MNKPITLTLDNFEEEVRDIIDEAGFLDGNWYWGEDAEHSPLAMQAKIDGAAIVLMQLLEDPTVMDKVADKLRDKLNE